MEEKKEKTIERAREYFHRYGYRKASLSELISEIGISKPTFYNYFKNKEELFNAVMLSTYNEFQYELSLRAKGAASAPEKFDIFIRTWLWFLDSYPLFRDLYRPGNDLLPRWVKSRHSQDIFAEGVETIRSILEEGQEEGLFDQELPLDQAALALYSAITLTLSNDPNEFRRRNRPAYVIEAEMLFRLLGRGLLARP